MKKLSIIIPMYNSEKTIKRCIDSILLSANNDIEIIVIDDCSTDKSFEICEKNYSDKIILLRNEENKGPSYSRNKGIEIATGDYISFVDSDDTVSDDYCFILLSKIKENYDILFFDFYYDNRKSIDEEFPKERKEQIIYLVEYNLLSHSCNKTMKKNLIVNHNLRFNENKKYGEDEEFFIRLLKYISSIGFLKKKIYCYIVNEGSLVTKKQQVETLIDMYNIKRNFLIEEQVFYERKIQKIFAVYNMYMLFRINFFKKCNVWKDGKKLFWKLSFMNKLRFMKYFLIKNK